MHIKEDIIMTEFSRRLKQARIDASITQEQLADKMKVSKSTISMWENGNRIPSVGVLIPLAEALKTTPSYLSGDSIRIIEGEAFPASSFSDTSGYSFANRASKEDILGQLINVALGLDDDKMQQLIQYAKFLESQEEK